MADPDEYLECARYGELPELKEQLALGVDPNHADENGNTALHKAAANGHLQLIEYLVKVVKVAFISNKEGNSPLHWAVQSKQTAVVKYLTECEALNSIDVLQTNAFGKHALTEAFNSDNADILTAILSHSSATEEKLMDYKTKDGHSMEMEEKEVDTPEQEVLHRFAFTLDGPIIKIREWLTQAHVNDMTIETAQREDDRTGLSVSAASIILSRWLVEIHSASSSSSSSSASKDAFSFDGKRVCELGAGCGLPGLTLALYTDVKQVVLTDYHKDAMSNLHHTIELNDIPVVSTLAGGLASSTSPGKKRKTNGKVGNEEKKETDDDVIASKMTEVDLAAEKEVEEKIEKELQAKIESHAAATKLAVERAIATNCISTVEVDWMAWKETSLADMFKGQSFDILLGADIVYHPELVGPLLRVVSSLLAVGGHFFYVAPRQRSGQADFIASCCGHVVGQPVTDKVMDTKESKAPFRLVSVVQAPSSFKLNPLVDKLQTEFDVLFPDVSMLGDMTGVFELYHLQRCSLDGH